MSRLRASPRPRPRMAEPSSVHRRGQLDYHLTITHPFAYQIHINMSYT